MVPALVIEDYDDARELYVLALQLAGFDARGAASARQALAMMQTFTPAVVIVDLSLPEQSGLDISRILRRTAVVADAIIVMVSGSSGPSYFVDAEAAGCDAALTKPCPPDELLGTVLALMRAKHRPTPDSVARMAK